jgi:hypothetical protein
MTSFDWPLFLRAAGLAAGFPFAAWLIGSAVLARWGRGLDFPERFTAAWGVGIACLAGCQFLAIVTAADQFLFNWTAALVLAAGAVWIHARCRKAVAPPGRDDRQFVLFFWLGYLQLLGVQFLLPVYAGGGWYFDWWQHFDQALVWVGDRPLDTRWADRFTMASRTPLFNLVGGFVLSIAGHDFWVFQLATVLVNWCFVSALALVLRGLWGARVGNTALLLAPLNLWMVHQGWFTWPKMLAAFYALLGLHCYLQFLRHRLQEPRRAGKYLLACWAFSLLGFLAHPVILVYLAALVMHAAWRAWRVPQYRLSARELAGLAAAFVLLIGPWCGWLLANFGLHGIAASDPGTPYGTLRANQAWRPLDLFTYNFSRSFVQVNLVSLVGQGNLTLAALGREMTAFYFNQLTGALTLSLCAYLALACLRRLWRPWVMTPGSAAGPQEWSAVFLFLGLGTLGSVLLIPDDNPNGVAHSAFFTSAILATGLAWALLARERNPWKGIVYCGMVSEYLFALWLHLWVLSSGNPAVLRSPNLDLKKDHHLIFLNDLLGQQPLFFVTAVVVIQGALIWSLVRLLHADAGSVPLKEAGPA